jgi:Zn-dependent protease with chaperone function
MSLMKRRDAWRTQQDRGALARRAELLLAAVAASIGIAAGLLVMCVVASARDRPRLTADVVNLLVAVAAALSFGVFVHRLGRSPRLVRRFRPSGAGGIEVPLRVTEHVAVLALATGQPSPTIDLISDQTVNASTAGSPGDASILLTTGACDLEPAQLDALLAYCLAQIASDELRVVRDASSAVEVYTVAIKVAWVLVIVGFFVGELIEGPWLALVAAGTLGLVFLTPCAVAATGALLGLSRAAGALTDSDAVRHTFRPDAYAELLIGMVDDRRETDSRLTPLAWLERATTRRDLAALASAHHSQEDIEYRARRMCAIAGIRPPVRWTPKPSAV